MFPERQQKKTARYGLPSRKPSAPLGSLLSVALSYAEVK
ncbi:hypothetical protein DCF50_p1114 [Dehalobacter sp. CF]|nr:hypothetical protein DCF50_p147 [Dehalobacter sp. CF]AFV05119.1 hypothetical protein DCF50_p1114 [Dehalobacter sp. CF]